MNNLAEFLADTDPTNSASRLALTGIAPTPAGWRLSWQGGSAAQQVLQASAAGFPTNTTWVNLFTNLPPTATFNSFTNPFTTNPAQNFRLRATRL
jgi:hypothetical protein